MGLLLGSNQYIVKHLSLSLTPLNVGISCLSCSVVVLYYKFANSSLSSTSSIVADQCQQQWRSAFTIHTDEQSYIEDTATTATTTTTTLHQDKPSRNSLKRLIDNFQKWNKHGHKVLYKWWCPFWEMAGWEHLSTEKRWMNGLEKGTSQINEYIQGKSEQWNGQLRRRQQESKLTFTNMHIYQS